MSVVIRGFDKPSDCDYCTLQDDGYCNVLLSYINVEHGIDTRCPLTEISGYTLPNGHKVVIGKTENSSEKPNNCECEPRKEQNFCGKCRYLYRDFKYGLSCYRLMDNEPCKYEDRKTEPTISKMEQVETMSCQECKHWDVYKGCRERVCKYEPKDEPTGYNLTPVEDEPQTERSE